MTAYVPAMKIELQRDGAWAAADWSTRTVFVDTIVTPTALSRAQPAGGDLAFRRA